MDAYPIDHDVIVYPTLGFGITINVEFVGGEGACSRPFAFASHFQDYVFQYFTDFLQCYHCVYYQRPNYPHYDIVGGLSKFTPFNIVMSSEYPAPYYQELNPPPSTWILESSPQSPTAGSISSMITANPPTPTYVEHRLSSAVNIIHTSTDPVTNQRRFQADYYNQWGSGYWRDHNSSAYDGEPYQEVFWDLGIGFHILQGGRLYVTPRVNRRAIPSILPSLTVFGMGILTILSALPSRKTNGNFL